MSNLSNQTLTLSNTAEIVENDNWFKLIPLQLNKIECRSVGVVYFV